MTISDVELNVKMPCAELGTLSKALLDCFEICSDLGTKDVTTIDYESAHTVLSAVMKLVTYSRTCRSKGTHFPENTCSCTT